MGGFASVVRGALAGANEAAGNDQTAQALEKRNEEARQQKQAQLHMQVMPHAVALRGLQTRLQAIDPKQNPEEYAAITHDIARNLHEVRTLLNPEKDPKGNFFERGISDKLHLTSLKARQDKDKAAQAKGNAQDEAGASAIAQGTVPYNQDPKFLQDMAKEEARRKDSAPKYENVKLADGTITAIDTAHYPVPPGATLMGKTSSSGVPRVIGHTSTQDALKLLQQGVSKFTLPNGQEMTAEQLQSMPPYMELTAVMQGDKTVYYPTDQRTHVSTVGNIRYQIPDVGQVMGNTEALGQARTPTTTTDPFGVTSTSSPANPGITGGGQAPPQSSPSAAPKPAITKGHAQVQQTRQAQKGEAQLDANGHIPAGAAANPQLVQAANSILDGMDVDKLPVPQRDRAAAMNLAQQYGWKGQGLFTPREVLQLKEGATVIQQMINSPALKVLDEGTISQLPMLGQGANPSKEGFFGRIGTKIAASAASPQQQEFMRYWRQLDALAVGLRALVQTGRATQAQVDRLIAELPNPYNTTGSDDAKRRLKMVQNELRVAAETGKLPDVATGGNTDDVDKFLKNFK